MPRVGHRARRGALVCCSVAPRSSFPLEERFLCFRGLVGGPPRCAFWWQFSVVPHWAGSLQKPLAGFSSKVTPGPVSGPARRPQSPLVLVGPGAGESVSLSPRAPGHGARPPDLSSWSCSGRELVPLRVPVWRVGPTPPGPVCLSGRVALSLPPVGDPVLLGTCRLRGAVSLLGAGCCVGTRRSAVGLPPSH